MAPNLAQSTLSFIHDMISSGELTTSQMAEAAGCSKRTVMRIRCNLRMYGSIKAPPIKKGRPQSVTPVMMKALCEHLLEKPSLYLQEMQLFLLDKFDIHIPKSTISDTLHHEGWSKKTARQKAREREMKTYVMNTGMIYRNSPHTTLFMWMNRDVINVLALEEQDGPL